MSAVLVHAAVDRVAREILRFGWSDGPRYSAGQSVAANADHDWVVVTRRGRPVVLAHDAFEAALWMVLFEVGTERPHPRRAIRMQSAAEYQAERAWRLEMRAGLPVPG